MSEKFETINFVNLIVDAMIDGAVEIVSTLPSSDDDAVASSPGDVSSLDAVAAPDAVVTPDSVVAPDAVSPPEVTSSVHPPEVAPSVHTVAIFNDIQACMEASSAVTLNGKKHRDLSWHECSALI